MSDANVNLAKSMYAAFQRGDIATIVKTVTPDISWELTGRRSDFPTLGTWSGPSGVQEFFATVAQHMDFSEFSPKEFYPSGDKVFVLGHYAATVKKTGKPMACDWCHVFTISGGRVTGFHELTDTAQAAAAYRG
jgi:ketosteroid isomerase-like protein